MEPNGYDAERPVGTAKRDLVVSRVIEAPVAAVWKAWNEGEWVKQWWGPVGFTCPVAEMDVREGGTSLVCMRSPAGQDMYSTWAYQKVAPLERLEYVFNLSDADGRVIDPTSLGLPAEFPRDVRHLVTFTPRGERTELVVTEYDYTSERMLDVSRAGLEQCLDKLVAALRG
jgi:uncharacterized protein YndB with AHSA1/START domain